MPTSFQFFEVHLRLEQESIALFVLIQPVRHLVLSDQTSLCPFHLSIYLVIFSFSSFFLVLLAISILLMDAIIKVDFNFHILNHFIRQYGC